MKRRSVEITTKIECSDKLKNRICRYIQFLSEHRNGQYRGYMIISYSIVSNPFLYGWTIEIKAIKTAPTDTVFHAC